MSYVVNDGRNYKEYDSLSKALKDPNAREGTIYEEDMFGNLSRVPPSEINNADNIVGAASTSERTEKDNPKDLLEVDSNKEKKEKYKRTMIIIMAVVILLIILFILIPLLIKTINSLGKPAVVVVN